MSEIKWQEPPPRKGGRAADMRWAEIADALRARPREWALVMEGRSHANAHAIKSGLKAAFRPAGSFDAQVRTRDDGTFDIYARYIGTEVQA